MSAAPPAVRRSGRAASAHVHGAREVALDRVVESSAANSIRIRALAPAPERPAKAHNRSAAREFALKHPAQLEPSAALVQDRLSESGPTIGSRLRAAATRRSSNSPT